MATIEMIEEAGKNFFIGVVEFDDCSEIMESFEGEIDGDKYVVVNTPETLKKLYRDDLIDKGEKLALENRDVIAFSGVPA